MEDTVLKRIMPHDSAAEKSVICCMLADKRSIDLAGELLTRGDFYEKQYGIIFEAMVEMNNNARPVDVITLQNHLREKDVPEEISSMEFIRELLELPSSSAYVKEYAKIVKEKALLRRLILASDEISADCYDPKNPLNEIFEKAEKQIFDIVQRKNTDEFTPINKIVESAIVRIQKVMESGSRITGIPTGFQDLDSMLSGLQPSDLVLIAARPSMGKTAFALNIAHHVAVREKETVVIFSLEMSKEQLVNRLLSVDSKVDAQKIRNASFEDMEIVNILESARNIGTSKLIIDDTSGISVSELRTKCRKYKIEHDLKLIVIDYLQLMTGSTRTDSRQQEISEISRSLKSIAREINVPVVA
ncbi:MAG: replicative DNA helicase, partial [Lachnospiraceae bacterium]|nr:replicative DNA helicase [Lachnospiraceae bacterium]